MKITIDIPISQDELDKELDEAIKDAKIKGLLPTSNEEWEQLKNEADKED